MEVNYNDVLEKRFRRIRGVGIGGGKLGKPGRYGIAEAAIIIF
jgi:hypothetical protein